MTKTILTAALLSVATLGAANAMTAPTSLVGSVQHTINEVGLDANASDLSVDQLAAIKAIDVSSDESDVFIRGQVASVLAR